jgi:hypothetical protein
MNQAQPLIQTHVMPLTTIRCERLLPWPGEVLVSTGQKVDPSDVVARAGQPRPHLVVDVVKKLRISQEEAERSILKGPGATIRQGDLLAQYKEGFWGSRKIGSPVQGTVVAIRAGRMLIEPAPTLYELRAALSGLVVAATPGFGVAIETPGALIQGIWGSGREGYGVLKIGVMERDATMAAQQIDVSHHGTILVCGAGLDLALLEKAQELQVRGLIVGGVPAKLLKHVARQIIPVIATEGIGQFPISASIFTLLEANEGRETTILAATPQRWESRRPEIIIPLPAALASPPAPPGAAGTLTAGQKVRIRRAPYWGKSGTLKTLYDRPRKLENDLRQLGADVVLEDGTVVFVPYVNLDIISS